MKNMKIKSTTKLLLSLLGAIMLMQTSLRAEIGFGEILGTAWTIGDTIIGETTLTPAYAVETWYWHVKETGLVPPTYYPVTKKLKRSRVTGQYFYYSKFSSPTAPVPESTDPFPVDSVNKLNTSCSHDLGGGVLVTDTIIETHTEFVWMAKVEQTGLWPDDGPWTVWLKTAGYKTGCTPRTPVEIYYWVNASIGKSGGQTVSLGNPNAILNYPFYLASEFYK